MDRPNAEVHEAWHFLAPFVRDAEACVFSRASYEWDDLDRERLLVIPPSIDAFATKNQELDPGTVQAILQCAGIQAGECPSGSVFVRQDGTPGRVDRRADLGGSPPLQDTEPYVIQVSRWDRVKDPVGVLEAFVRGIAPRTPAHLVLAGPAVSAQRDALPADLRDRVHLVSLPMDDAAENAAIVNGLQRQAAVVVQKSLAEGFGLTVAEAMWKGRPVVASRVGGIKTRFSRGRPGCWWTHATWTLSRTPWWNSSSIPSRRPAWALHVDLFERLLNADTPPAGATAASDSLGADAYARQPFSYATAPRTWPTTERPIDAAEPLRPGGRSRRPRGRRPRA